MDPLISILIPCHNAAPFIAATLESALAQTWPKREIIVVDDGSTDDSLALARRFESRGVQVLDQPNRGASAARNRALQAARGDYFQFLDADDLLSPKKIAAQLAVLATRAPGTLGSCRWGRFTTDPAQAVFAAEAVFRDFSPIEFLQVHTGTGHMMHPGSWLVPRAVAEQAGPWNEKLSLNDDGEYFARVVLASAGIAFAPAPAASYYRSGLSGSLSQRRSKTALASLALSIELIAQHLTAADNSPRTRQALADYWQRLVYELYPGDLAGSRQAESRAAALGGSRVPPPLGYRQHRLARFIGWRLVYRIFRS